MDRLLRYAQALYRDRSRLANATVLIVIGGAFYMAYGSVVLPLFFMPIEIEHDGWVQGIQFIYSYNTLAFIIAVLAILVIHALWTWAFLPSPAVIFVQGILRGVFGQSIPIARHIGGRFRVQFVRDTYVDVACRIHDYGSDEWFTFRLRSSPFVGMGVEEVALRHGLSYSHHRLMTRATSDELYGRTLIFARAMIVLGMIKP